MFSTPPNRSSAAARMVDRVKLIRRRYWHDRTLPSPGGNTFFRLRGRPHFSAGLECQPTNKLPFYSDIFSGEVLPIFPVAVRSILTIQRIGLVSGPSYSCC